MQRLPGRKQQARRFSFSCSPFFKIEKLGQARLLFKQRPRGVDTSHRCLPEERKESQLLLGHGAGGFVIK